MCWLAITLSDTQIHVIPEADLKPHFLDTDCWCCPSEDAGDDIWVHRAMDQREDFESGKRKPS